jgi:hypothetical protein
MTGSYGEERCRELLEVGPEATLEEVRRAHAFLKGLYAPGSAMLAAPSMDEFAPEAQARILAEVEEAYLELCALLGAVQASPPPVRKILPDPDRLLDGPGLRRLRETQGFTLDHLAAETSVRLSYLEALEEERFQDLPSAAVIVRGYLTACFAALGMSADASVADYVRRYQHWQGRG